MNKKVFITGSSTGLGLLTAQQLIRDGYEVYLHARNDTRARVLKNQCPQAAGIITGDLSVLTEVRQIATQVNQCGQFATIIHNAGVYTTDKQLTFQVNLLAPYVLTGLITPPQRLIYISSNMHQGVELAIDHLPTTINYSSSKLAILLLMKKVARLFSQSEVSAVDPGWVPTRMGGQSAPDRLIDGYQTQVWLAEGKAPNADGNYFYHQRRQSYDRRVDSLALQDQLATYLAHLTGIKL